MMSCLQASWTLVRLLKSEYDLTGYFKTVQLFFLMEAGDTMQQFYTDIFQRVRPDWRLLLFQGYVYLTNCFTH